MPNNGRTKLQSMKSVGPVLAHTLPALLPELRQLARKQITTSSAPLRSKTRAESARACALSRAEGPLFERPSAWPRSLRVPTIQSSKPSRKGSAQTARTLSRDHRRHVKDRYDPQRLAAGRQNLEKRRGLIETVAHSKRCVFRPFPEGRGLYEGAGCAPRISRPGKTPVARSSRIVTSPLTITAE